jgi:hypothetical protein
MDRSLLRYIVTDANGHAISNAKVFVYKPGTTTQIDGKLWDARTGGTDQGAALITNTQGEALAWLEYPCRVDLRVSDNSGASSAGAFTAFTESNISTYPQAEETPQMVNAGAFGLLGGANDDGPKLQAAITYAGSRSLWLPAGVWTTNQTLVVGKDGVNDVEGAGLVGDSMTACTIKAGANMGRIITWQSNQGHMRRIELNGNSKASKGMLVNGGWRSEFAQVWAHNCTGDGLTVDAVNPDTQVNNEMRFVECRMSDNGGDGFGFGPEATGQHESDGITYEDSVGEHNTGSGLFYVGVGARVNGGTYHANGEYGIKIGRPERESRGVFLETPWIEENGSNGIIFINSWGCVAWRQVGEGNWPNPSSGPPMQQGVAWGAANCDHRNTEFYTDFNTRRLVVRGLGLDFQDESVTIKGVNGVPSNADFQIAPPIGTLALNKSTGRVYCKTGASAWTALN